jgi:hypothetical protein
MDKRRTFVIGGRYEVGTDEIRTAPDAMLVHLGDPPFTMRIAPPEDPGEKLVELADGWFLTDLDWLGPKRAKGRLLDGLLNAAADAADLDAKSYEEEGEAMAQALAAERLVDAFLDAINAGHSGPLGLLVYEDEQDYARVHEGDPEPIAYEDYHQAIEVIEEEAGIRGVETRRLRCTAEGYFAWLAAQGRTNGPEARSDYVQFLLEEGRDAAG